MIHNSLFNPQSIVVVGGSDNTAKPGGKILENLIQGKFPHLYVLNPKGGATQGVPTFTRIEDLPSVDLAILAIAASDCLQSIKELSGKGVKSYIIISAGFGEFDANGKMLEEELFQFAMDNELSILGPNCIGIITEHYKGAFTLPIPKYNRQGIEFVSSSGSTAVFTMEAGIKMGLQFSNIYSVGNAIQIDVEDIIEYIDSKFDPDKSSKVLMIYIEQISNPGKLIKHCRNLILKGCNIVGIKSGVTEAGSRAASSHTGAMASPEIVINTVFQKAGIIKCQSRDELIYIAGVLYYGKPTGRNNGIITHAGGAGVMCTDALESNGMNVPEITQPEAKELLSKLYNGSSVANPIDFLATGNAEQLGLIIDYCNEYFDNLNQLVVIFGSPGLVDVTPVYIKLLEKMQTSTKPIYPVIPSLINSEQGIEYYLGQDKIFFSDEVKLANAVTTIYNAIPIFKEIEISNLKFDDRIEEIVNSYEDRYLSINDTEYLMDYAKIPYSEQIIVSKPDEISEAIHSLGFPVVMKAVGILHKSEFGGVIVNINSEAEALESFKKLTNIEGVNSCSMQKMVKGHELFIGAKREDGCGHILLFGLGGIYLEILKDVQSSLIPVSSAEAKYLIKKLKLLQILEGTRGKKGIDIDGFATLITKVSQLLIAVPEIAEMDINPVIAEGNNFLAVDTRIRMKKN